MAIREQRRDSTKYQASVRVSDNIRKQIEYPRDRLYIGSYSCRVFDHFHVKRCNKCQKFGHYLFVCTAEQFTCGYCTENHDTNQSPNAGKNGFVPCCVNCKSSKNNTIKHSHIAFELSCPSYRAEQGKMRRNINYYDQKNSQLYN